MSSSPDSVVLPNRRNVRFLHSSIQFLRERETVKAVIFFTLTALLATVAGLITHFDALALAAGLPVSSVASIVPLWVMTALRSIAVIGFLLASRLKQVSFQQLRRELVHSSPSEPLQHQPPQAETAQMIHLDYQQLARELAPFFQATHRTIVEEEAASSRGAIPILETGSDQEQKRMLAMQRQSEGVHQCYQSAPEHLNDGKQETVSTSSQNPTDTRNGRRTRISQEEKIASAYQVLLRESPSKRISARALSERAKVRRLTCSAWLNMHHQKQEAPSADQPASRQEVD